MNSRGADFGIFDKASNKQRLGETASIIYVIAGPQLSYLETE
jgi:hypothetical protein